MATRQWWQQPGTNACVWNRPLGAGCVWGADTDADTIDLRNGGYINPPNNNGSPIWVSQNTGDPVATFVTNFTLIAEDGTSNVNPTFNIHVPNGAYAAGTPGQAPIADNQLNLIDVNNYPGKYFLIWPMDMFNFSQNTTYTLQQGNYSGTHLICENVTLDIYATQMEMNIPPNTDVFATHYNQAAGVITAYDIDPNQNAARVPGTNIPYPQHVLRYSHDPKFMKANGTGQGGETMNPSAWPAAYEDWQDPNQPGNLYTGNLLYGTLVGIPNTVSMPAGLSDAGKAIWYTLQTYGALPHDVSGGGLHLWATQDVCGGEYGGSTWWNNANNDLPTIVKYLCPLRNQHKKGDNFADFPVNGPGARLDPGPPPLALIPGFPVPSDNGTSVSGTSGSLTDTFGNIWTITSGAQVAVKKPSDSGPVTDTNTANATQLVYVDGVIWHQNTQGSWYGKTAPWNAWSPGTSTNPLTAAQNNAYPGTTIKPTSTPAPTASPDKTELKAGSTGSIVDTAGNTWSLTSDGQVSINGTVDQTTACVSEIAYVSGNVWMETTAGLWWSKTSPTAAWSPAGGSVTSPLKSSSGATITTSTGPKLLPAGYLSTSGNQIVDQNGNPVRIAGINWLGGDSASNAPLGLTSASLSSTMSAIAGLGFNTVRLPYNDKGFFSSGSTYITSNTANSSLVGQTPLQVMDAVIAAAGNAGLKVIIAHYNNEGGANGAGGAQANGLWFDSGAGTNSTDGSGTTGAVTQATFQTNWTTLATRYKGNSTVVGFDLHHEPSMAGSQKFGTVISWGDGGATDIKAMYQTVGNAILSANPNVLIICQGPMNLTGTFAGSGAAPEGDLSKAGSTPVTLSVSNKLVYSVHQYPAQISGYTPDSGATAVSRMNSAWGNLVINGTAPVMIGSMGASLDGTSESAASGPTYISPGSGSFTDASGNVYTLSADGVVTKNGTQVPNGAGTDEMAYWQGTVYARDQATQNWYTFDGNNGFTPSSAPPAGTTSDQQVAAEEAWAATLISYSNGAASSGPTFSGLKQGLSFVWNLWGDQSGQVPDGVLSGGWSGTARSAQQQVYSRLQYVLPSSAPVPPKAFTVSASTPATGSVPISWTNAGSGVSYQPQYRQTGASTWTAFGSPITGLSVIVTGLLSGVSYDFEVVATNTGGVTTSNVITAVTATSSGNGQAVAPSAPTNVAVSNITSGSVSLSWGASSGTSPITYQPQYRPHQTGSVTPTPTPSVSASSTPTPTPSSSVTPTPSSSVTPTPTATAAPAKRNWAQNPGGNGTFWVQPFYSSAAWITSGPLITTLRNGSNSGPTGYVHLPGDYCVPWVVGTASDPLVTVTDGNKSIKVRVPAGTKVEEPSNATYDRSIGGADSTQPYLVWSISGASIDTGTVQQGSTITGTYGFQIDDGAGPVMEDQVTGQPGTNNSLGAAIQDFELTQARNDPNYVIPHMLQFETDPSQVNSTGVWPLKVIDNSYSNTGSLPQGITIGIPANVAMPSGLSRGAQLLWTNLQQYGWYWYNVSGNGCASIGCYQTDPANSALASDIAASISNIMQYVCILNYDSTVSGSQYSQATTKGYVAGATSAFAPPPPIDLSPTNGVDVAPSSFGAWSPSGYNVTPNNSTPASTTTPTPTPSATSQPAAIFITPGNGSFNDAAGNVYTLSSNGDAMENGQVIPNGGGTSKMAYYNGQVYGQDAASGSWYTYGGSGNWNGPVTAPPGG